MYKSVYLTTRLYLLLTTPKTGIENENSISDEGIALEGETPRHTVLLPLPPYKEQVCSV